MKDNIGENISQNPYYGEYTFHYWFWKNYINKIDDNEWVGFCAYRRFWSSDKNNFEINNLRDFLSEIPKEWESHDVILGQNIYLNWKFSKILRHGLRSLISNPKLIFKKIEYKISF